MKKVIALIFGGKSAEHEVSIRSAKNIFDALDRNQFSPILVGISQTGSWFQFKSSDIFPSVVAINDGEMKSDTSSPCTLAFQSGKTKLLNLKDHSSLDIDCAFPILHGTMGEDGTIQGLFKMVQVPFVGCGVWSSAAGMDKEIMKRILDKAGIQNSPYMVLTSLDKNPSYKEIVAKLGTPFFIKPANAGSSVGVHKIKTEAEFGEKLKDAFQYDHKILAEKFIQGKELECSVKGLNHAPVASLPGQVIPQHDFYSYEAKYLDDNGAIIEIPAKLKESEVKLIQKVACDTYKAMGCDGLTRVDFFLQDGEQLFVNEINTLPGFTKISMYPKMWEASGTSYTQLVTELIQMAFERHRLDSELKTTFL